MNKTLSIICQSLFVGKEGGTTTCMGEEEGRGNIEPMQTYQDIPVSLEDIPQLIHTDVLGNVANKEGPCGLGINVSRGGKRVWHVSPAPHWTSGRTRTMGVERRVAATRREVWGEGLGVEQSKSSLKTLQYSSRNVGN